MNVNYWKQQNQTITLAKMVDRVDRTTRLIVIISHIDSLDSITCYFVIIFILRQLFGGSLAGIFISLKKILSKKLSQLSWY